MAQPYDVVTITGEGGSSNDNIPGNTTVWLLYSADGAFNDTVVLGSTTATAFIDQNGNNFTFVTTLPTSGESTYNTTHIEYTLSDIADRSSAGEAVGAVTASGGSTATSITQVYQQILGRTPDANEVSFWQGQINAGNVTLATLGAVIAFSVEAQADLTNAYQNVFGAPPTTTQLLEYQDQLADGTTLTAVEGEITASAVPVVFQQTLGRDPTSSELVYWQGQITAGSITPAGLHVALANSTEAGNILSAYYQNLIGQAPSASQVSVFQTVLAKSNSSLAVVQATILSEAEALVPTLYLAVLGRTVDPEGLALGQEQIAAGIYTVPQLRAVLAASPEAAANIGNLYQQILGRPVDSGGLSFWLQQLSAGNTSVALVQMALAASPEGAGVLTSYYQFVFGQTPDAGTLASYQSQLGSAGSTLASVEASIRSQTQPTQTLIQNLYQQVLNRAVDASSLTFWEQQIAAGNTTIPGLRPILANSPEAAGDITGIYQQVLGRNPTSSELSAAQQQLATAGTTLPGLQAMLATSAESVSNLTAAYQTVYASAPSNNALVYLESVLASGQSLSFVKSTLLPNPIIIDTASNQQMTDQSTLQPFASVIISDPQNSGSMTALIASPFPLSDPRLTQANGYYVLSGNGAADLTSELQSLVFTPPQGLVPVGQVINTGFSLTVENTHHISQLDPQVTLSIAAVSTPTNLNFIYGSIGSDTLVATSGADAFGENLSPLGNDTISGFDLAHDVVQLSTSLFPNFAAVQAALTSSSGNAVLHFGSSDSMTLLGINPSSLQASNFRLV